MKLNLYKLRLIGMGIPAHPALTPQNKENLTMTITFGG